MATSFSVRAILSATDKGFTSTLKNAIGATESLASRIKSGFTFGMITRAGEMAFNSLTSGASELIGEVNSASKSWQTFEGNMKAFGKTDKEIAVVQKALQSFAETTVYSSSDMASTFAQLEAVGVGGMKKLEKGTEGLVKGFGGLAAASEDPAQAMKSLSQQATQMAAKPKVAWEDFKIMLEQSPAGMAAVAKEMGISTEQLISKIQAGEVATEDFFSAIEKAGNSDAFQEMATKAKTMDQALDGVKETLGNKLLPAFQVVSEWGIKALNGIADKIGKIDGEALAEKVSAGIKAAKPYWDAFMSVVSEVGGYLKKFGTFLAENKDTIAKYLPTVLKLVIAFKGFQIIGGLVPGLSKFAGALTSLAGKGISGLAAKLFGISTGEKAVGTASQTSAGQTMAAAKSFMMMGAAVLMVSAGFALLAYSAVTVASAGGPAIAVMFGMIAAVALLGVGMGVLLKTLAPMAGQMMPVATAMLAMGAAVLLVAAGFTLLAFAAISLANAGTPAILCMVGLVAAIALLAAGAAALGPALTAGSVGFIAFGAAILMVGAGALLAAAALAIISAQLPTIAAYGMQGALAIAALGAGMMVFAAGATLAGVSAIVLGAGLLVASAGMIVFGVGVVAVAAGMVALAVALKAVNSSMKSIAKNAKATEKSLKSMKNSVKVVESGLDALGSKAKSGMNALINAFNNAASKAKSAGQKVGTGFSSGVQSGMTKATAAALAGVVSVNAAMRTGYIGAYSAGAYVSMGFANGLRSMLSAVRSAADALVREAERAIRAKAQIHSPSRLTDKLGSYFGEGWVEGVLAMAQDAKRAAEDLVSIPAVNTPNLAFAGAYGGELSAEYDYTRKAEYNITVVSEIDGREVAKGTAAYMQDELDKKQTRSERKNGRV
jgi:tape measure domain-containing protein